MNEIIGGRISYNLGFGAMLGGDHRELVHKKVFRAINKRAL